MCEHQVNDLCGYFNILYYEFNNMANQHVVRRWDQRGVLWEWNWRTTENLDTQKQAFERARQIANNQGGDVFIHWRNWKFRERNTYGKEDLFPPRG